MHIAQLSAYHKHNKNLQPRTKILDSSVLTNKIISVTSNSIQQTLLEVHNFAGPGESAG